MASQFAMLRDVRPYKTSWRVQVKVLHSWRQYTNNTGETLELVLADSQGVKIHASVKKDLVAKYVNSLQVNEWKFIEHFALTHAAGQFRPTGHLYKMSFVIGTTVTRSDIVSDSSYLTLARFSRIQNGDLNPYMLIDVMGQVVNIGELEILEANNKPTTKLDFELRDEHDDRMSCTLWGTFAEKMFQACQAADGIMVICVIRFAKIKAYKGVRSLSNSFDASQVHINPPFPEIEAFTRALPSDGLALTFRESVPKFQMVTVNKDDDCLQFERKTISDLFNSTEIGKARVICTIYGIDTDWAWYMLYAKVMDNTGETKCLLFDSICSEIVGESAASLLGGSFNEIEDPTDLPDVIRNLVGKTFLFLLCVEKENIWDGKDSYKVSRILNKDGLLQEDVIEESEQLVNPASIVSGDQCLMLTMSQDTSDSSTPSSKRVYAPNLSESEQSSSSKKVCIEPKDLQKSELEFGENGLTENGVPDKFSEVVKVENVKIESTKGKGVQDSGDLPVTEKKDTKQANQIDAFIPPGNYLYNFRAGLKEGHWYYMADFHVVPSTQPVKYSWNRFALECIWPTTMWPVSPRCNGNFFNFIHSDEVEYAGLEDKQHVSDAIGVVSSVSAIQRFPFVCRQGETGYEARYVVFEIKDDMGRKTICVAKGRSCQAFVTKWFRKITSVTYNYDPVVIVLRFWRVAEFEGQNCLMSEFGCSRLFLDPTFPDFDIPRYIRGFAEQQEDVQDVGMELEL
ncbi:Replication protein A OB domain [Arabidopsis thaliana x Arabidopsis arenosa]|uniref:Replication protein A OB domain n=1 Tax=Arabidopsis thaliana x Arabidopsis arenosa TaxID=1240361 RepID=A0A8T2A2I0_9BRAS|nr:Replication protein A OB domain [Arabidopsis thaliana x Arabidopsis arenosa]